MIVGKRYFERGESVTVLVAWRGGNGALVATDCNAKHKLPPPICVGLEIHITSRTGPRNVLIQRTDGSCVVRPFRGLRAMPPKRKSPTEGT